MSDSLPDYCLSFALSLHLNRTKLTLSAASLFLSLPLYISFSFYLSFAFYLSFSLSFSLSLFLSFSLSLFLSIYPLGALSLSAPTDSLCVRYFRSIIAFLHTCPLSRPTPQRVPCLFVIQFITKNVLESVFAGGRFIYFGQWVSSVQIWCLKVGHR
jgi:hypothetical protein